MYWVLVHTKNLLNVDSEQKTMPIRFLISPLSFPYASDGPALGFSEIKEVLMEAKSPEKSITRKRTSSPTKSCV
jgi:hypothetical protein